MRKGRFDEIFFVDLPGPEEREAIFAVHLRKRHRDKANFDMAQLVAASEGFSRRGNRTGGHLRPLRCIRREDRVYHRAHSGGGPQHPAALGRDARARRAPPRWAKGRCVMAD